MSGETLPVTAESTAEVAAEATSIPGPRRIVSLVLVRRVVGLALSIALLTAGIALGYAAFQSRLPVAPPAGDPVTAGQRTPPVVEEFAAALRSNDADAIRSAVPTEPYKLLTNEMQNWSFEEVTSVETLATYVDGARTSTAIVLVGRGTDGNAITINLIVHTDGGQIASFR